MAILMGELGIGPKVHDAWFCDRERDKEYLQTLAEGLLPFGGTPLFFLVMDRVDAPSIRELVNNRDSIGVYQQPEWLNKAAASLKSKVRRMHDAGFVHEDMNDGNVLVTHAGEAMLVDYDRSDSIDPLFVMSAAERSHTMKGDNDSLERNLELLRYLRDPSTDPQSINF
jgi:serine/threonine protein kinase